MKFWQRSLNIMCKFTLYGMNVRTQCVFMDDQGFHRCVNDLWEYIFVVFEKEKFHTQPFIWHEFVYSVCESVHQNAIQLDVRTHGVIIYCGILKFLAVSNFVATRYNLHNKTTTRDSSLRCCDSLCRVMLLGKRKHLMVSSNLWWFEVSSRVSPKW